MWQETSVFPIVDTWADPKTSYIENDLSECDADRKLSNAGEIYECDMAAQTGREAYIRRTRARRNLRR